MAISITPDSATIGTTEYSLPADSTTLAAQTDDCILQVWLRMDANAAGDNFELKIYEKVNAGTAMVAYTSQYVGAQSQLIVTPSLIVGEGWDVTLKKIAGTDRAIAWSLRKIS